MELQDWKPGDKADFRRWGNYWQMGADGNSLPYLGGAVYRLVVDDSIRFLELRAGNLDVVDLLAPKDLPAAKAAGNVVVYEKPWQGTRYQVTFQMMPSKQTIFFKSKDLRKAVAQAIDRGALAKTLGMGAGREWQYLVTEGQIGYDPSLPVYSLDPAKSKQLVAAAGYPNGVDVAFAVHSRSLDQQQAQMLQQMFNAVGIRITIDVLERLAWNNAMRAGQYELASQRSGIVFDPGEWMNGNLSSAGTGNWANWENAEFDKCVEEGIRTYDDKQRHEVYKRCYLIVFEEAAPRLSLWLLVRSDAFNTRVKGLVPVFYDIFNFTAAWLEN
jgi:peptide/nickel transport system substrate-binding protein